MKLKFFPILMMAFALTLSACDSDSDDGGDDKQNFAEGKMEASIDGTQWDATNATANKVGGGGFFSITIAGAKVVNNNSSADAMTISLANQTGDFTTGTFQLGELPLASMSFTDGSDLSKTYIASTGTVTITKINDDEVEGTFSMEAINFTSGDTITITGGSFDVKWGVSITI
jgi:hypothetical protein